ncbi:fructosamine kinase family protein [Halorussus lipolyticus]|uniref:fructosamine kinase family protein n=1 Tax=Halorussus lipolyticus TaxID=3034024 RepID=UPI0023E8417C|nr:fructosamine kinase family protein [Halorussus sp. DT80]
MTAESDISTAVEDALGVSTISVAELDGGEVGRVHRVSLADGRTVAAKTGDTPLEVEAFMLSVLGDHGLAVPEVFHAGDDLLVLEYVEGDGEFGPDAQRDVARRLAALHEETPRKALGRFGFPRDTLSGPYRQPNPWTDSWVAFYRDHRLRRMAEAARDEGLLSASLSDRLDALADDLGSWLPDSPRPSLIHGDVWAENVVARDGEVRAFLDPACYVGHAEIELAYADFAGLGEAFFETYDRERGLDSGFFEGRRAVYQLYPLLEHLRYFEDDRYARKIETRLTDLGY